MPVKRIASAISDTGIVELRVSIQRLIILCFMTWVRYRCNIYSYHKFKTNDPIWEFFDICVKNGAEKIVKRKVWPCHLHCASLCQTPEKPANLALLKIIFFPKQEHKTVKSPFVLTTVCDCFIVVGNIYIDYLEIWIYNILSALND